MREPPDPLVPEPDDEDSYLDAIAQEAAAEFLNDPGQEGDDDLPLVDESMLPEVVTELTRTSDQHSAQIEDLRKQTDGLDKAFQVLEESLAERIDMARPSRWAWPFLTRSEAESLWNETRWFVDDLVRRYPLASEVSIPPCWYRHEVARDELSDCYSAWREAFCGSNRPSSGMTAWRDRWLWPMLQRLALYADWRECKERRHHVQPTARQDLTDADFDDYVAADLAKRPDKRPRELPWPVPKPNSPAPASGARSVLDARATGRSDAANGGTGRPDLQ